VASIQTVYGEWFGKINPENLPDGWTMCSLDTVCSKIGSGATPTGGKSAYLQSGISLIRSTNVFDYQFAYDDLAFISDVQAKALNNVIVHENDVLFNITGVSVARCCIVPPDVLPARVNQHVMIVRPHSGEAMSYYLLCLLCANENKQKLLGIGQSGSTREAINQQELKSFAVALPPKDIVNAFGKIASTIYSRINANTQEILRLIELQSSLLSKLAA